MEAEVTSQKNEKTMNKVRKPFRATTVLKVFLAYCCIMVGLTQASRLAQWEEGTLVLIKGNAEARNYHGKVSREFLSGNYLLEAADGSVQVVQANLVRGVESRDSGITFMGVLLAAAGIVMAALLFIFKPIRHLFRQTD
ncbi:hypothetical protein [Comamonas thiooxydans]|nr:hypothetical protein [Comamonas thiooxydans]